MATLGRGHRYNPVPHSEDEAPNFTEQHKLQAKICHRRQTKYASLCAVFGLLFVITGLLLLIGLSHLEHASCDSVDKGYQCQPNISHYWGQYSPYFSVPSDITADVPEGCQITFAQVLSRHGARDPTATKTLEYAAVIAKIHSTVQNFPGKYAFLKDYKYKLGADQLTTFGEQGLVNSGIAFYNRYKTLTRHFTPFVRASGQTRVVQSARNFSQGFHQAKLADKGSSGSDKYPYPIITISEEAGKNNTLDHGLCTVFEEGPYARTGFEAQKDWVAKWVPPITARLNANLAGANLNDFETIHFMDLCPFETVASPTGQVSVFCGLFSEEEWHQFDYYQSLGKFYQFGNGNPLGPTQGVGFANELIARMTGKPVNDHTTVNHTLDDSESTFPIGPEHKLFADFSHDNDLTAAFAALGLYNSTALLSNTSIQTPEESNGYSVAWTVPFAGRAYFEKIKCGSTDEELVRVLVNDRVRPLETCGGDELGRCTLKKFIESLSFARSGGHWDQCFAPDDSGFSVDYSLLQ